MSFSFLLGRSGSASLEQKKESNTMSQHSFPELGVSAPVVDALRGRGIAAPFRIQTLVLPDALAGLDVLAKSPTGSGKTLAFAVPIVESLTRAEARPSALVLVPTRELAGQVTDELRSLAPVKGLKVQSVYGGVPLPAQAKAAREAHVLVATPGRLEDLANRRMVDLSQIRIFVLDEADRMLDMGFKPQVDTIVRRLPKNRQTMFFSATLDGEVGEIAHAYTSSPSRFEAELPSDRAAGEIQHRFVSVGTDNKVETLVEHIRANEGLTLVCVRTKRGADRLASKLTRMNVRAVAMHGDLSQRARERALEQFEKGRVQVLIATDVAARGLDIDDIANVVNYDPPEEDKGYVHRTGRTGRAGKSGVAVTFVLPEQQAETSRVASRLGHREQFEEAGMTTARPKVLYTSRRRGRRSKW
jgi:superfamily II DNA/RNA helicase